ncbi:exocyst complex component EXO70I-like [Salvia hispanica]|uniref:exocyst complex component EXO70I-like n=1 Tax=Salvia hispanica TaxID=49212 RepID=UPI0020095196|nr:exocyst complex component EXO70I-like [Salvia hispanica]
MENTARALKIAMEALNEDDEAITKLETACSDLKSILNQSLTIDSAYNKIHQNLQSIQESLTISSKTVAPLQSLSIANKALDTRINRAVSPALSLLSSFTAAESLQRLLLDTASELAPEKSPKKRLAKLIEYVACVDRLDAAIGAIGEESEPAIQKLQEVVEFLSRTKAADLYTTARLRETLATLKALCEAEVDAMRFDGVLDEALLNLQDEYEALLLGIRYRDGEGLGTEMEIEVLEKISQTLAANDCLDICIDMFVKVRYRRAAKALMRLNPDYLKRYTPEEIDEMQWEDLETSISLWMQHLELAVKAVLVSEKRLCHGVLGGLMGGAIWPECFIKIADKIMAVFFRFGEGVARSDKAPQKLFKLLDMFDSLEALKPEFEEVFEGEAGADICARFRELEKLLVHASTRVFWELGLQIEGSQDGLPPPVDGSVPKLVRYAVNYLKNLAIDSYSSPMEKVLRTQQLWKGGTLSDLENDGDLLRDAISNVMEAIQRNIESKKSRYKDKVVAQIFLMNTYWYIYMRTRNTELGKLLGEAYMKKRYRNAAEESAYLYQKLAWGRLVRLLEKESDGGGGEANKLEAFMSGFDEMCEKHICSYNIVYDADLRDQIKEATLRLVLPVYTEFYDSNMPALAVVVEDCRPPELIESSLRKIFEGGGVQIERRRSMSQFDIGDE